MTASSSNGSSTGSTTPGISIKPHDVQPPSEVSGMTSKQIMDILGSLDDEGTAATGRQFSGVGKSLNRIATQINNHGKKLSDNWKGKAATSALNELKTMHDYVAQLAAQAAQTGAVLEWLGNDVLPQYKRLPDPSATAATPEHANSAAREYLTSLSHHIVAANKAMPSRIVGEAPVKHGATKQPARPVVNPANPPSGGGGGTGPGAPPAFTGGPTSPAGALQGVGPGVAAPPAPAAPAMPAGGWPGAGPNGYSAVPVVPVGGGLSGAGMGGDALGAEMPGAAGTAAGTAAGAADGAAGDAADAAGAAGAEDGMGAFPMAGGAGGQQDEERQRQAWMQEDDIWGLPADSAPPVIGAD